MRVISLSLLLVSLSACDPDAMSGKPAPAEAAKTAAKPEAAKSEAPQAGAPQAEAPGAPVVVAAPQPGIHECLTACDNAKLSHTDRATCRLNCGPAPVQPSGAAVDGGVAQAMQCFSGCHEGKSGDAKTCSQGCVTAAKGTANAPAQAVLEQLGTCVGDCYADKSLKSTDRETCKLTCEQVASSAGPGGT